MRRSVCHQALSSLLIKSSLHLYRLRSTEYRTLVFTHLPSSTFPTRTPIFPQFAVGNLYFLLLFSAFLCLFHFLFFSIFLCCVFHFPLLSSLLSSVDLLHFPAAVSFPNSSIVSPLASVSGSNLFEWLFSMLCGSASNSFCFLNDRFLVDDNAEVVFAAAWTVVTNCSHLHFNVMQTMVELPLLFVQLQVQRRVLRFKRLKTTAQQRDLVKQQVRRLDESHGRCSSVHAASGRHGRVMMVDTDGLMLLVVVVKRPTIRRWYVAVE